MIRFSVISFCPETRSTVTNEIHSVDSESAFDHIETTYPKLTSIVAIEIGQSDIMTTIKTPAPKLVTVA